MTSQDWTYRPPPVVFESTSGIVDRAEVRPPEWPGGDPFTDGLVADSTRISAARVVALSRWVDEAPANAALPPEALTWLRIAKLSEEVGETVAALIAVTGSNPRKGVHGTMNQVAKELLDTALTALCAYEHVTGHTGHGLAALFGHIEAVHRRAGLVDDDPTGATTNEH